MGNPHCKWVCDRLPLLAGDDLLGSDRRRVERHLIGCPKCRQRKAALGEALGVLRGFAAQEPVAANGPTLWPALARQIRESRRPVPSRFRWSFDWSRLRLGPTLALGTGLVVVLGLTVAVQLGTAKSERQIVRNSGPFAVSAPAPVVVQVPTDTTNTPKEVEPASDSTPPSRYDFVLDHGTPMGPDSQESKSKLTH